MGVYRHFPYSNFHEMNLDEIIKIVKDMLEEWAQYYDTWDDWKTQVTNEWAEMQNFINNYFDNLNVQTEINNKIIAMVNSGEFGNIVSPYIPDATADWLAEHITQPVGVVIDTSLSVSGACADAKVTGDAIREIDRVVDNSTDLILNKAVDMPNLPATVEYDSTSATNTIYNSYAQNGAFYVDVVPNKYYLTIIKFHIMSDDTATAGTLRVIPTEKDTTNVEPFTISRYKDTYMSSAPKDSDQLSYCIGTVPANTSIYYKLTSFSSGTASRHYHIRFDEVITLEFDTLAEAENFADTQINETTQLGWVTAIDRVARKENEDTNTKIDNDIDNVMDVIESISTLYENSAKDMPSLPTHIELDTSSGTATILNTVYSNGLFYVDLESGKYYLNIIKLFINASDTSTTGTLRLVITEKDTTNVEPLTVDSRKDLYLASAPKNSEQYIYNIGSVASDVSVYYKAVSYSSGSDPRHYDITFTDIITLEFDTLAEATAFIGAHHNEITQNGWGSAIDRISRKSLSILSDLPFTGKTCCVLGDSLSASYYDMWCSYFASETGISLTNHSAGGTSIAVRAGRTDSFVERLASITDTFDLFVVFGGMNDKDGVPIGDMTSTATTTFYGAYKAIINDIQSRANHPIMIMVTPYHNVDAIVPYIEAIRDIATFYGIPLVDIAKISGVNPSTRSIYTRDWTHPNQLLCDRIRPQITRELVHKIVFPRTTPAMPN